MNKKAIISVSFFLIVLIMLPYLIVFGQIVNQKNDDSFRNDFSLLCKSNIAMLKKKVRDGKTGKFDKLRFLYAESYSVRGLNVAYDITGKNEYLEICKEWSDQQIKYQEKMQPEGAYYMGYARSPGSDKGDWYTADCSSVALAILATASRCEDILVKQKYINSVKSFAKLVLDNYVGSAGGITDGIWDYDGEWWCSSGIFGSVLFQLYKATGDKKYFEAGLVVIDWLNLMKMEKIKYFGMDEYAPAVIMYTYEAYTTALPYLKVGSERRQKAISKIGEAVNWMLINLYGNGNNTGKGSWYERYWGQKMGGFPFHIYTWARYIPEYQFLIPIADKEMKYLKKLTIKDGEPFYIDADHLSIDAKTIEELNEKYSKATSKPQIAIFLMMSYAEKLSPGAIYK